MNKKYRRGAHKATIRICLCLKNCSTFRLFASLSLQMQTYFRSSLLFSGWEKKEATTGNTSVFVGYSPLFFRKIVEIEHFALRAAIFVSNAPSQTWGVVSNLVRVQGTVWEEFLADLSSSLSPPPPPFGKDGRSTKAKALARSRLSYGKLGHSEQSTLLL